MKCQIIELKPTKVIGIVYKGKNANGEIPEMWNVFNIRFKEIKNPDMSKFYGLCYDLSTAGAFTYMAGLGVDTVEEIPNGMELQEIPGGKYAIFTFKDHISQIGTFWDEIYKVGLKANNLEPLNSMTFELYDERFQLNGECDIYIPVK